MSKQTIYIVDDDSAFTDSLTFLLADSGYRLRVYSEPVKAIEVLGTLESVEPACLLLDVRMPQMSGIELHEKLRKAGIDLPVIYLTGHADVALAVEAMGKGALTFLEKPLDLPGLTEALTEAFSPPVQSRRQSSQTRLLADERASAIAELTTREVEVLNGVVEGYSARRIGELLFISSKTVDFHRANLMSKLKVKNVAELQRAVALLSSAASNW